MINIIDPYWWNLGPVPVRNEGLPRIDIGQSMFKIAKRFLCDDCRQKLVIEIKEIDKKD